jgi:hypothetical protein
MDLRIRVLSVVAVLALLLSTGSVVTLIRQASQREHDRIESDLAACDRANELRANLRDLGEAQRLYVDGILDTAATVSGLSQTERDAFAMLVDPARADINETILSIQIVDCRSVVPGAG